MEKDINERIIKLTGQASIDYETPMELGDDVTIRINGQIVKVEELDNQDGTKNIKYVFKSDLLADIIIE